MGLNSSISGINAAQQEMSVISNNIVNAGTIGFKKGEAEFAEIYSSSVNQAGAAAGQGVELTGIRSDFTQGEFEFTSSNLDLAIDGGGLFVLKEGAETFYSRAGSFRIDGDGFILNSAGQNLQGFQPDGRGAISEIVGDLRLDAALLEQKVTSLVTFKGNLDSRTTAPNLDFDINNPNSYCCTSSLLVYDSAGSQHELTLFFAKNVDDPESFDVYVAIDNVVQADQGLISFNPDGSLRVDSAAAFDITGYQPEGAEAMDITIDLVTVTSFGSASNTASIVQDGYEAGELLAFGFDETGTLLAQYSNGETRAQGQVVLASFNNPSGLSPAGSSNYAQTDASGVPSLGEPSSGSRGFIRPSALENSNVDITAELLALIEAQRNFQSNAQAIQSENDASQAILQLR